MGCAVISTGLLLLTHAAYISTMSDPFAIIAGVFVANVLCAAFAFGCYKASKVNKATELSIWENAALLLPLLFVLMCFYPYL